MKHTLDGFYQMHFRALKFSHAVANKGGVCLLFTIWNSDYSQQHHHLELISSINLNTVHLNVIIDFKS
jgi:hypothetical protein